MSEKALQSFQKDGEVFQRSERTNRVHGFSLDGMQKMNGAINVDFMTEEEIHQKLEAGYKDMESGKVREASIV